MNLQPLWRVSVNRMLFKGGPFAQRTGTGARGTAAHAAGRPGDAVVLGLDTGARWRGHSRLPAVAAGHRSVPRRSALDRRLGARGGARYRRADHGVLRMAVEPGRRWPRCPVAVAYRGGPLLPLRIP